MWHERAPRARILWRSNNQIDIYIQKDPIAASPCSCLTAQLGAGSAHNRFFVLLELKQSHAAHRWLIFRDAVSEADYRKLRARLFLDKRMSLGGS